MSLRRYFKQKSNLPTSSQTQLPTNVLREVNLAVTAALGRTVKKREARSLSVASLPRKGSMSACIYDAREQG